MHAPDPDDPELLGQLADAAAMIKNMPLDDSLVARCRERALAVEGKNAKAVPHLSSNRLQWGIPLTTAAMLLLTINLLQAYSELPAADRQQAAIRVAPDGQRLVHFSDLRIEPASTSDLTPARKR